MEDGRRRVHPGDTRRVPQGPPLPQAQPQVQLLQHQPRPGLPQQQQLQQQLQQRQGQQQQQQQQQHQQQQQQQQQQHGVLQPKKPGSEEVRMSELYFLSHQQALATNEASDSLDRTGWDQGCEP